MFHVECLMTCFLWQLKLESIRIGVRYDCSNDMTAKFPFLHFDLTLVLLGRFSIEKKGKISHFWPGPPLEKCETCKRKIFKHELTNVLVKEKNIYPYKPDTLVEDNCYQSINHHLSTNIINCKIGLWRGL